jgi:hypothetical protein
MGGNQKTSSAAPKARLPCRPAISRYSVRIVAGNIGPWGNGSGPWYNKSVDFSQMRLSDISAYETDLAV